MPLGVELVQVDRQVRTDAVVERVELFQLGGGEDVVAAVQVDLVRRATTAGRGGVRVQLGDDPEIDPVGRPPGAADREVPDQQQARLVAGRLVAVLLGEGEDAQRTGGRPSVCILRRRRHVRRQHRASGRALAEHFDLDAIRVAASEVVQERPALLGGRERGEPDELGGRLVGMPGLDGSGGPLHPPARKRVTGVTIRSSRVCPRSGTST